MRRMVIDFSWNTKYVGEASVVLEIAAMIDEHLMRVQHDFVDGKMQYYFDDRSDYRVEVLGREEVVQTAAWYEEQLEKRKEVVDGECA